MLHSLNNNKIYITVDSIGAQLRSIADLHGVQYLWQGSDKYWRDSAILLFPIIGALRDKKALINGEYYSMPSHGIARGYSFKKIESGADALAFEMKSNEETKKMYPFDFTYQISFELTDMCLTQRITVINDGDAPMPYTLGCHPGFNVPFDADEEFGDYVIKFEKAETCDSPTIEKPSSIILEDKRMEVLQNSDTLSLTHEMFYNDALILENIKSRSVTLMSTNTYKGVQVDFDGFDYLGLWQFKDAPFVCVEPWTGTATTNKESDDFASKRGMKTLNKNERAEYIMRISLV